eukprot:3074921-Pyramimonas_sp.AAC.1
MFPDHRRDFINEFHLRTLRVRELGCLSERLGQLARSLLRKEMRERDRALLGFSNREVGLNLEEPHNYAR